MRIIDQQRYCGFLLGVFFAGCSSNPAGIAPAALDPAEATARAMTEFDSNADQKLSTDELNECRGLLAAMNQFDQDGDKSISADELSAGLAGFQKQDASLIAVKCVVNHNSQPLEGATVEFVPEPFLGGTIKSASGVTGADGSASPSIPEEDIPEEYRGRVKGVYGGIYRVVVTHPTVKVPAKYGEQTEVGRIVSRRNNEPVTINF